MDDEEEFETLCRELEESSSGSVGDETADSTFCVRDTNSNTVLDEIDEFLEESQGSLLLRSEIDIEKVKGLDLLLEDGQVNEINTETQEEKKNSHSDSNNISNLLLEDKCSNADEACMVRLGDGEVLDYSLLDTEESEEPKEKSTVTDILSQLLDNEEDVATETIDTTKQELQKVTRGMIEQRYYNQLELVWSKYSGDPGVGSIPPIDMIPPPRIYRDRKGEINGFETVEEYIDSNHPLRGGVYRDVFTDILRMEENNRRKKYREGTTEAHDLGTFSRPNRRKMSRETRGNKDQRCIVYEGEMEIGQVKAVLIEMYQNSIRPGIEEAENARMSVFQTALKEKLRFDESSSCQCRHINCRCTSGMSKRFKKEQEGGVRSGGEWRPHNVHSPSREARLSSYTEEGGWDSELLEEY